MKDPDLRPWQRTRAEVEDLHDHQTQISGFAGERACHKRVTKGGKQIPLKLGNRGQRKVAFLTGVQKSTSYSCPFAYQQARFGRETDTRYLLDQHASKGLLVLSGSFGMATRVARTPERFYHPQESFRGSEALKTLTAEFGKFTSIHQAKKSSAWGEFLATQPPEPSYQNWDLNRRLDAVGAGVEYSFRARDFTRLQKRVGVNVLGYLVATEVETTPGVTKNGHPTWAYSTNNVHIHFLLFLNETSITSKRLRALLTELHKRWSKTVSGYGFCSSLAGSDLRVMDTTPEDITRVGRYLSKGTKSVGDPAGLGGSFWDALRASAKGDVGATIWWQNWEGAVRGRHLFRVSHSLMKTYDLMGERSRRLDAWKATREEPVVVAFLDRGDWWLKCSLIPGLRDEVLRLAETEGVDATVAFLKDNGFSYTLEQSEQVA